MEVISATQYKQQARLVRYMVRRVADPSFCVHEFSARCKRGIEWREEARNRPIPKHRSLTIIPS
jgi:hypothetical protein